MDFKKAILYGALFWLGFTIYQKWQADGVQKAQTPATLTTASQVPTDQASPHGAVPATARNIPMVEVETDVLKLSLSPQSGEITEAKLLNYPKKLNEKNNPYELFTNDPAHRYVGQSGFLLRGHIEPIPFQIERSTYQLADGEKQLVIRMVGQDAHGLHVAKIYTLERGSYKINLRYELRNLGAQPWAGQVFNQFVRTSPVQETSGMLGMAVYQGAAVSDPNGKRYQKVSFGDIEKTTLDKTLKGGWVAMQDHYFLTAWVPDSNLENRQYSYFQQTPNGPQYTIGNLSPQIVLLPNQQQVIESQLYVGPEIAKDLAAMAPGLEKTVDYGWLWFLSNGIFWLMSWIYKLCHNWGVAIILVTVVIKLAFFKLSTSAYSSMARMRQIQPRMLALREKFGDDKAKLSQETMALYKNEKINPLGGCLPMLIQIPVFIALYWVLLESVELRQAPFFLWIRDLSSYDPFFILPILMGASLLWQQKLNPAAFQDPVQQKMMMLLPVVFTVLFIYFPSGLVLYMVVNNVLSIIHQWYVMYKHDNDSKANKNPFKSAG